MRRTLIVGLVVLIPLAAQAQRIEATRAAMLARPTMETVQPRRPATASVARRSIGAVVALGGLALVFVHTSGGDRQLPQTSGGIMALLAFYLLLR